MNDLDTTKQIVDNYHSNMPGRVSPDDYRSVTLMNKSFRRILGGILPHNKDACILDIGCGEGHFLRFCLASGYTNLHGFDLSQENVALCRKYLLPFAEQHNALDISGYLPGRKWHAVICLDILEHIQKQNVVKLLTDIRSRLEPDGLLIVQVPNMAYLFAAYHRYADLTHETGFTENSLMSALTAAGYKNIKIMPAWNAVTPAGYIREFCLLLIHRLMYMLEGRTRPRIPTKNLLAIAFNSQSISDHH